MKYFWILLRNQAAQPFESYFINWFYEVTLRSSSNLVSKQYSKIFHRSAIWPSYTTNQNSSTPALQWYAIRTYFRRKNIPKFWTEFVKLDVKLKAIMFYIMYQIFSHQRCSCNEKFEVKDTWSMTFFTTERWRALQKTRPTCSTKVDISQ